MQDPGYNVLIIFLRKTKVMSWRSSNVFR